MITKKTASRMLILSAAVLSAAAQSNPSQEAEIRSILSRQQTAWNRGDTEGFLQGYASNTTFVGDKITKGLEEVRVRYQTHYPTLASMGHLTFSDLEIHFMGPNYAYVLGRWRLERTAEGGGEAGGIYSLIFERTAKGWKIIMDHTT